MRDTSSKDPFFDDFWGHFWATRINSTFPDFSSDAPEGYTKLAAKEWEKQLQNCGVELDEVTANFVYAVSLYEDPILRYQDAKDMFDGLAEVYFGENLENSIALVKEAMKH